MEYQLKLRIFVVCLVMAVLSQFCTTPMPNRDNNMDEISTLVAVKFTQTAMSILPTENPIPSFTKSVPSTEKSAPASSTTTPTSPSSPETGGISGKLSYPSERIPPLQVFAFNLVSDEYYYVTTSDNQSTYLIDGVPPGDYLVVAYLNNDDYAGGYTQAVICGLSVDCTDHSLIPFRVEQGLVTSGINPMDWYAPEGDFPPNPLK